MNCVVFWDSLLSDFNSLGKGVSLIYVFIMAIFGTARCRFLGSKPIFYLQITGVLWQAKCTIIQKTKVYKVKTMV